MLSSWETATRKFFLNKRDEEMGVIGVHMVRDWRLRNQSSESSGTEIKEYKIKVRTLRNTTRKGKVGVEMGVYGDRERALRKIWGKPVKSIAGTAKQTRETMNEYRMWSIVSKAAHRSRRARYEICYCEMPMHRWSCRKRSVDSAEWYLE